MKWLNVMLRKAVASEEEPHVSSETVVEAIDITTSETEQAATHQTLPPGEVPGRHFIVHREYTSTYCSRLPLTDQNSIFFSGLTKQK